MRSYVIVQRCRANKSARTKTAFKRLLARMRDDMRTEMRRIGKGQAALSTLIRFGRLTRTHVQLQCHPLRKGLVALLTAP